jgi:pSer/pThr/pTyr-binding forkhead associated (FHA) protein
MRAVILKALSGSSPTREIRVEAGSDIRVGRSSPSDVTFPQDHEMSSVHFGLRHDGENGWVSDLNSRNGTRVNGELIKSAILWDGDSIVAGQTKFTATIERNVSVGALRDHEAASAPGALSGDLLEMLCTRFQPLYAVLDAARDPQVLELIRGSHEDFQSLYEGERGEELANFAPYLVRIPPHSPLLDALVREGWGKSWGVYLTCAQPLKELRRHFRHFLMVQLPDGREVYFRYYDPRVLRAFLPSCTFDEGAELFGPIQHYLAEAEDPGTLLEFTKRSGKVETIALRLQIT